MCCLLLVYRLPDLPHCMDCADESAVALALAAADAANVAAAAAAIPTIIVAVVAIATAGIRLVQWPHDAKDSTRGRVGRLAHHIVCFVWVRCFVW